MFDQDALIFVANIVFCLFLLIALLLGVYDSTKKIDRGFDVVMICAVITVATWIGLLWFQPMSRGYYWQYAGLSCLPVVVWFVYYLFEPLYWDWQVLAIGMLVCTILFFLGYVIWPALVVGYIIGLFGREKRYSPG